MHLSTIFLSKLGLFGLLIGLVLAVNCSPVVRGHDTLSGMLLRPCQAAPRLHPASDAAQFVELARDPGQLFTPNNPRQNRPLFILLAALLAALFRPIVALAGWPIAAEQFWTSELLVYKLPEYAAYVSINAIALLLTLLIFDRLFVRHDTLSPTILLVSVGFAINRSTMSYIWYPHTQLLNMLLPVLFVAATYALLSNPAHFERHTRAVNLGAGFLVGLYGSAVLALPIILTAYIAGSLLQQRPIRIPTLLSAIFWFLLPYLIWIGLTIVLVGTYYNREVVIYRQFVWVFDALQHGGIAALLQTSASILPPYLQSLGAALWPYVGLAALCLLLFVRHLSLAHIRPQYRRLLLAALLVVGWTIPFLYLLNYPVERLMLMVTPPLLVCIGVLLKELNDHITHSTAPARWRTRSRPLLLSAMVLGAFLTPLLLPNVFLIDVPLKPSDPFQIEEFLRVP